MIKSTKIVKLFVGVLGIDAIFSLILTLTVLFETISLLLFPIFRSTFHFDQSALY